MNTTSSLQRSWLQRGLSVIACVLCISAIQAQSVIDWEQKTQQIHQQINRSPQAVLELVDPLIEQALEQANTDAALQLLADKVWSARLVSQYDLAIEAANRAIRIATQTGNNEKLALIYNNLGGVYWSLKDFNSAMDYWMRSLRLREQLGDPELLARSLNNIALIYIEQGELDKARQWLLRALQVALSKDKSDMSVVIYGNLGDIETRTGNYERADDYYNKAEEVMERSGDERARVILVISRAHLAHARGELQKALRLAGRGVQLAQEFGNTRKQIEAMQLQAKVLHQTENNQQAARILEQAVALAHEHGRINDEVLLLQQLAEIQAQQQQWQAAFESLRKERELSNLWTLKKNQSDLERMQSQFEWAEQQKKMILLKARQQQLEKERAWDERERRWLLLAIVILVLIASSLAWVLRKTKRLHAIVEAKNRELENIRLELHAQARVDPLTRLYNRRAFMEKLQDELSRMKRTGRTAGLALMDLDHFKQINDQHGHVAGDQILQGVASRMRNTLREVDILARWGGEEFIVLMPDSDLKTAENAMERLRQEVAARPYPVSTMKVAVTVSIGVTEIKPGYDDFQCMYHCVDHALYAAKREGRNRIVSKPCDTDCTT